MSITAQRSSVSATTRLQKLFGSGAAHRLSVAGEARANNVKNERTETNSRERSTSDDSNPTENAISNAEGTGSVRMKTP